MSEASVSVIVLAGGFTNPARTAPDRAEFVITVVATVVGLGLSLVLTSTQAGAVIHGGLAYLWVGSIATVVVGWQQREP